MKLIQVDETLFHEGWKILQQHQDKRYSLTDRISFAIMRKLSIDTALAFDKHFRQARFHLLPDRSVQGVDTRAGQASAITAPCIRSVLTVGKESLGRLLLD